MIIRQIMQQIEQKCQHCLLIPIMQNYLRTSRTSTVEHKALSNKKNLRGTFFREFFQLMQTVKMSKTFHSHSNFWRLKVFHGKESTSTDKVSLHVVFWSYNLQYGPLWKNSTTNWLSYFCHNCTTNLCQLSTREATLP